MKTPEGYEKADIDKFLASIGAYVAKPATFGYGKSGLSDRLVCIKGKFVAIEVKREGKQPTPLQWQRMKEVEAAGGKAFWGTAAKVCSEINNWLSGTPGSCGRAPAAAE